MKNLKNNNGVTLLELVVAVAILALLGTAIVGIMGSNTAVFRKNKADIGVQMSAEETYNKLQEDIMQAEHIYIEGYATDSTISFPIDKIGGSFGEDVTAISLLKTNDITVMNLTGSNYETFINNFCKEPADDTDTRESRAQTYRSSITDKNKLENFNTLFQSLRYMDYNEATVYGRFLDYVSDNAESSEFGPSSCTAFDDASLKKEVAGKYKYKNIYITKAIVVIRVPVDTSYVSDTSKIMHYSVEKSGNPGDAVAKVTDTKNDYDYCICEYTFNKNTVTYTTQYYAMDKLNTDTASDKVFSNDLNWVNTNNVSELSGVCANIDGQNERIGLEVYFNDKNRVYNSKGLTYLRNSYVLHDAK